MSNVFLSWPTAVVLNVLSFVEYDFATVWQQQIANSKNKRALLAKHLYGYLPSERKILFLYQSISFARCSLITRKGVASSNFQQAKQKAETFLKHIATLPVKSLNIANSSLIADHGNLFAPKHATLLNVHQNSLRNEGLANLSKIATQLTSLIISGNSLTMECLPSFAKLPNLTYLDVRSNAIASWKNITTSTFPKLKYLDMSFNSVQDDASITALAKVVGATLKSLIVSGNSLSVNAIQMLTNGSSFPVLSTLHANNNDKLDNISLAKLTSNKSITNLDLSRTKVSLDAVLQISLYLPQLKRLSLVEVKTMGRQGDQYLEKLLNQNKQLVQLDIADNNILIQLSTMSALLNHACLQSVNISGNQYGYGDLPAFKENRTLLTLNFAKTVKFGTSQDVQWPSKLKNLQVLNLQQCNVTDELVKSLATHPTLKELNLSSNTTISYAAICAYKDNVVLETLDVGYCNKCSGQLKKQQGTPLTHIKQLFLGPDVEESPYYEQSIGDFDAYVDEFEQDYAQMDDQEIYEMQQLEQQLQDLSSSPQHQYMQQAHYGSPHEAAALEEQWAQQAYAQQQQQQQPPQQQQQEVFFDPQSQQYFTYMWDGNTEQWIPVVVDPSAFAASQQQQQPVYQQQVVQPTTIVDNGEEEFSRRRKNRGGHRGGNTNTNTNTSRGAYRGNNNPRGGRGRGQQQQRGGRGQQQQQQYSDYRSGYY